MKVEERERCGYRKGRSGDGEGGGGQVREKYEVRRKVQGGGEVRREIRANQIVYFYLNCGHPGHHFRATRKLMAWRDRVSERCSASTISRRSKM